MLVGNSIGAFSALLAASLDPELCQGLVLLNAAGRFEERQPGEGPARQQAGDLVAEAEEKAQGPLQWALRELRRALAGWAFYSTKLRIENILQWVYVNEQQARCSERFLFESCWTLKMLEGFASATLRAVVFRWIRTS